MKKYIAMLMSASLLLTGSMAYASDTAADTNKSAREIKIESRVNALSGRLAEIKPLTEEMRANRAQILELKATAKEKSTQIKQALSNARAQKDTLTDEQITTLKDSVKALKNAAQEIKNTKGQIKEEVPYLKEARKNKDIDGAKARLQNIIDVQKSRIDSISAIIEEMDQLLTDLTSITQ